MHAEPLKAPTPEETRLRLWAEQIPCASCGGCLRDNEFDYGADLASGEDPVCCWGADEVDLAPDAGPRELELLSLDGPAPAWLATHAAWGPMITRCGLPAAAHLIGRDVTCEGCRMVASVLLELRLGRPPTPDLRDLRAARTRS